MQITQHLKDTRWNRRKPERLRKKLQYCGVGWPQDVISGLEILNYPGVDCTTALEAAHGKTARCHTVQYTEFNYSV